MNLHPAHNEKFRWLPRNGEPSCIGEWLAQSSLLALANWKVYTGVVVTMILVVQLLHPFGLGA